MRKLMKREWKRCWKRLVKSLLFQMIFLFALMAVCILKRNELEVYVFRFFLKSTTITAFSGYTSWNGMGNMAYYLLFAMMFLNVSVIWNACMRTLRIVYMDEENQAIYSMCNQMYGRKKLAVSKYLWAQISVLLTYLILSFGLWGAIFWGNTVWGQETDWKLLVLQTGRVILVATMMISITFLYAVCTKACIKYEFVTFFVLGTLFLGNLYKFRDILFWALEKTGASIERVKGMTLWMDKCYWISPLSWLNPEKEFTIQLAIFCIVVSIIAFLLGLLGYKKRNL